VEAAAFLVLAIALRIGLESSAIPAALVGPGRIARLVRSSFFSVKFASCAKARCAVGCQNGDCLRPGDCICQEGFHGALCDEPIEAGDSILGTNMCKYADASSSCRLG
jgi:hypothetical protein